MSIKSQNKLSNEQSGIDSSGAIDSSPLLATKLYRPPTNPDVEQRARLLERLNRNLQRPLTLISAPAGYGKTVLASQWVETCGYPSAWLSLDESDNDLLVFVKYLLAAVTSEFPDLGLRTINLLRAPHLPSVSALARALINDLDQIDESFILVLDEIHHIHHQQICNLFDILLKYPPQNLHLVLIGRHDPAFEIVSLRARSQVTEIRMLDLRFTPQETIQLMQKMLGREVDPAVAADWTQNTEGWVTALRLAVLSLRQRGQADDLSVPVQGDSRYLRDYLLAEVLTRLPRSYHDWLIKTALLDSFCAPLCEVVCRTGKDEDESSFTGETFIDWLECENLFLAPLDDQHTWFRFHHLFQEMLLNELQSSTSENEIADLRLRASKWCAENELLDEALQYALAAGEVQAAVSLVERNRYALMNTEQWHRLARWLQLLPDEVLASSPSINCTRAFLGIQRGHDQQILIGLQQAERLITDPSPGSDPFEILRGEVATIQSFLKSAFSQPAHALSLAQYSLERLPQQAWHVRMIAIISKVLSLQMLGDIEGQSL